MINLKKVSVVEVKKCFVVSQLIRQSKGSKKYLSEMSPEEFKNKLDTAKAQVSRFTGKQLDKLTAGNYKKRLKAYNNSVWYIGEVLPNEVGVWKRAGGLPLSWTNGSLEETAMKVKISLENDSKFLKRRVKHAIPNILKTNINKLQKEKYLLPIIFQDGVGTNGRRKLKKRMKGDIDDGCMRSIALVVNGAKKIKAYIGYPKIK